MHHDADPAELMDDYAQMAYDDDLKERANLDLTIRNQGDEE